MFTGGGGAGNELIFRLLKDKYNLSFCDANINSIDPSIPDNRKEHIPLANSPDFVEEIKKICKERSVDLLVPSVDEELLQLKKIKINTLLPDNNYIEMMIDKFDMIKAFETKGLNVPRVWKSNEIEKIDSTNFPLIVKPRHGRGSKHVELLNSKKHFESYLSFNNLDKNEVFLEQFIDGIEYTILMAANKENELKAIVPVKVLSKKGITISAITEKETKVIEFCEKMHSLRPTKGCYNIQLKLSSNGNPYPFEINPRISTTFGLGLASGVDPISIYLEGEDKTYNSKGIGDFKEGVTINRHWHNYVN
tara:strand:+ start:8403 stop:9323 length:921 start_codon:yes stop_codon:yes gene_type:complete